MSVSNINSSSVDKIDKSERLQTDVDITMSIDYIVFIDEDELTGGDIISQTINDFIVGNELSVDKSPVEKAIIDILQPYNLNHEISSINLNIETPIITEGSAEKDINDIISNIEKTYSKVSTTVNTKNAKCEKTPSGKKKSLNTSIKQETSVCKTQSNSVSLSNGSTLNMSSASDTKISNFDSGAYISASTGAYISATTEPYISTNTSSASHNPSLPQNSNKFENGINILAQTVSNTDSTFTSLDKEIPLPKDFILDSNNKIHIDPKLPNIGNAKIVTTVSKETAGTVLKKAGTVGTVVTSGITAKEGYDKLQKAKTNEEKGQISGETTGKIVGSFAGGAVGSDLGAQLGGVIVITALAAGAALSAPAVILIIGGCALGGAIVGGAAGDAIGGGIGKASGGTIGKMFDTNASKK